MNSECRHFQSELADVLAAPDPAAFAGDHAGECAACARWLARQLRLAGVVRELERKTAPPELAGRVVAALEAGARQTRAVRAVQDLRRPRAPETLDRSLAAGFAPAADEALARELARERLGAPPVLERLVVEELAEPEKFRVRRFVGGLPRIDAPAELADLVHARLLAGNAPTRRPRARRWAPGPTRAVWASLAAVVLVAFGLQSLLGILPGGAAGGTAGQPARRPFHVQYTRSLDDLDPVARSLVDGVSGGLLTAREL